MKESKNTISRLGRPQYKASIFNEPEELSTLIHKIGHEIGNPLTAIISYSSIIERFSGQTPGGQNPENNPLSSKLTSYAGSIIDESWKVNQQSERLVMLLSQKPGNTTECPIADILKTAIKKHSLRNKNRPLTHRVEIKSPEDFGQANADPEQFVILLCEFLANSLNAIEFFYGKDSQEKITVAPINEDNTFGLSVSNSKPSAYPEELSNLLDPYVSEYVEKKHLGLGFCVCHAIASRFNAQIRLVETTENEKITFSQEIIFTRG
ncbi:MAG: HAMP domain-containing histidine kinase [Proteobacteria bacterium]|nr:HAMP domain-containing histidine kinase [Pseudomonadota bacterium]